MFIQSHVRHERDKLRQQAMMDTTAIGIIGKLLSGAASKQNIMGLYPFLWTQEERQQAKLNSLRAKMEASVCNDSDSGGGDTDGVE